MEMHYRAKYPKEQPHRDTGNLTMLEETETVVNAVRCTSSITTPDLSIYVGI